MTEITEATTCRRPDVVDRDGDKIGKIDDVYQDRAAAGPSGRRSRPVCSAPRRRSCRCTAREPVGEDVRGPDRRRRSVKDAPHVEADGELSEERGAARSYDALRRRLHRHRDGDDRDAA